MTHDELLKRIGHPVEFIAPTKALRAVAELHSDDYGMCMACEMTNYPCPTIQAIEKELR